MTFETAATAAARGSLRQERVYNSLMPPDRNVQCDKQAAGSLQAPVINEGRGSCLGLRLVEGAAFLQGSLMERLAAHATRRSAAAAAAPFAPLLQQVMRQVERREAKAQQC